MSPIHLNLSPLPALPSFLVQRAQTNQELQDALDDGLEDYAQGAEVLLTALRALLEEWLQEGEQVLWQTSQFGEPYKWLATHEHLRVVQQFRDLL